MLISAVMCFLKPYRVPDCPCLAYNIVTNGVLQGASFLLTVCRHPKATTNENKVFVHIQPNVSLESYAACSEYIMGFPNWRVRCGLLW